MNTLTRILIAAVLCPLALPAQTTYWQTTRNGNSSGQCQLETNRITVTVNPFFADVEEEAVIATRGEVWWGDPATLEIVGTFTLTDGSCVRSMLLWNGTQILKAKLRDRNAADSAYQAVVNRQRPRDPALIEYQGNGQYEFRIFPVALNGSRKIRILYTVPLQVSGTLPQFRISPAFTYGASQSPTQIPVLIRRGRQTTGNYILTYGNARKTVQFGASYQIPYSAFVQDIYDSWGYYRGRSQQSIILCPDTLVGALAYGATISAGNAAGKYAAIFAAPPDMVIAALEELAPYGTGTLEARVIAGEKSYITDVTDAGILGIYVKSTEAWDQKVHWTVYNSEGRAAVECSQPFEMIADSLSQAMLPLVWGTKYSLVEGLGSLGALFGFVDANMSLLALESDSLGRAEAEAYAQSGVPPLLPAEIVIKPSQMPVAPDDNIIFEYGASEVVSTVKVNSDALTVQILAGRVVSLRFRDLTAGSVKAVLLDLSGRAVATWNSVPVNGGMAELRLPQNARGCLVLRVYAGNEVIQKRITVGR